MSWLTVEPLSPTMLMPAASGTGGGPVAGAYHATTFTVRAEPLGLVDMLDLGASISLDLDPAGSAAGRLRIPAVPGVSAEPIEADLSGGFAVRGVSVVFAPSADSLLGHLLFAAVGDELRASYTFLDAQSRPGTVNLVLTRP